MELYQIEELFNTRFDIMNQLFRPGLFYEEINCYFIYTYKNYFNEYISYYIVHLPYSYYMILPFDGMSMELLKSNCWRLFGDRIVGLSNENLYNEKK